MARIFASTVALAAAIAVLLVFGAASAVSYPGPCSSNFESVLANTEERLAVDNAGNANGVVCSYIGKNPLPKNKAAIVDDREFVKK